MHRQQPRDYKVGHVQASVESKTHTCWGSPPIRGMAAAEQTPLWLLQRGALGKFKICVIKLRCPTSPTADTTSQAYGWP
jgi:hypothetical protein